MRSMLDFELPERAGNVSLCELDGRAQYVPYENGNLSIFTASVSKHPRIHITRDTLHPSVAGDEGRSLFLHVDVPFLKQLTQAYSEQGLIEAFYIAADHNQFIVSKAALLVLGIIKYVRKCKAMLNPLSYCSNTTLIDMYSQTKYWMHNSIRYIAWHPYTTKVAVATCDDSIRIYSSDNNFTPLLRCKHMKNISCLAWRPLSNSELAVGHEGGIVIWSIDPNSFVQRPSIGNAIILQREDHEPVISIAWSPQGNILISASASNTKLLVWDIELDKTASLVRPGGLRNTLIKWSPAGDKLMSVTADKLFRVWDCYNWECERWTVLMGRVQTACWSACGKTLLFATTCEPIIYGLKVKSDAIFTSDGNASQNHAVPIYEVTKTEINGVLIGGLIKSMEMDPKGKHLAVMFEHSNNIAIFSVANNGMQILASSVVIGLPEETPSTIAFQSNFLHGACLTIGWSSGRIQYYPIIYSDLTSTFDKSNKQNVSLYSSFNTSARSFYGS